MNYDYSSLGRIVRQFLLDPYDYKNFRNLFELSARITMASLRNLRAKGFSLSISDNDATKSLNDLAIDCLDDFFLSSNDQPFFVVFDFFRRQQVTDPDDESDESLGRLMMILLIGYNKKKLSKISDSENRQVANLKKRVKEILNSTKYRVFHDGAGKELVCLASDFNCLRRAAPPLDYDSVYFLAEEAYFRSSNREDWCYKIMEAISAREECQNFVSRSDLLRTMIAVNAKYLEVVGGNLGSIPEPKGAMIREAAIEAKEATLVWIAREVIARYVAKSTLTEKEAEAYLKAVDFYLSDFIASGMADSLPDYFREVMPKETHCRYLKDYKNSFETVIKKALEYFKNNLGDFLQKRGLGTI